MKIKNNINIFNGIIRKKDYMAPGYINLSNPKIIEIDNMFYSGIIIVNYYREYNDLLLKKLLENNLNMNISLFYEKQNTFKTIRDLTYHIANVGVELKDGNQNRQDIDLAAFTYNDAKYIRKEIQVNNEDLYFLYFYIEIYSKDIKEIEYLINKVEGILNGEGIQTKRANFRQEQVFLACTPLMLNSEIIKSSARRNVLTSGLLGTYPFISSSIFDEHGIFMGINSYNNSLIFIDRFNSEKYKNANMCIFGTSGSGKSFFTKLMILRNSLLNIEQYVIDPEREYTNLADNLNGTIIKIGPNSKTYINIFDIRKESLEGEEGYLATKISKLIGFFNLIFGEINEEEKGLLEEKIIECYFNKNINFEDNSLFNEKKEFKSNNEMPKMEEFYNILGKDKKTKKFQTRLIPFVKGSLKFFNNYTNVEINNKIIIADVYDLGEENLKYGMYLFTDLFWDKIKINRKNKKIIYLDEVWRLIGITSNKEVAGFIYKIFKTIRKYSGSSVAITQDISDLFSLEDGIYGKSILNNSNNKAFFSLEEENILILNKYLYLTEKEKIEIKSLKRGECLMFAGDNHILTKIESEEYEKKIIE